MPLADTLIRQLAPPVEMLLTAIDTCPDDVWAATVDGDWPIWQHILHATYYFDMWMRTPDIPFAPPPGVDVDVDAAKLDRSGDAGERGQLRGYLVDIHARTLDMLSALNDGDLTRDIEINGESKPLMDTTIGQIRHLMYHAGCVSTLLRRTTGTPLVWIGYHKPL
jgi:hypothetical protein